VIGFVPLVPLFCGPVENVTDMNGFNYLTQNIVKVAIGLLIGWHLFKTKLDLKNV
jgi:hypothetical protein